MILRWWPRSDLDSGLILTEAHDTVLRKVLRSTPRLVPPNKINPSIPFWRVAFTTHSNLPRLINITQGRRSQTCRRSSSQIDFDPASIQQPSDRKSVKDYRSADTCWLLLLQLSPRKVLTALRGLHEVPKRKQALWQVCAHVCYARVTFFRGRK